MHILNLGLKVSSSFSSSSSSSHFLSFLLLAELCVNVCVRACVFFIPLSNEYERMATKFDYNMP